MSEVLEVKVVEIEQRCKSNTRRIDKLEENTDAVTKLAIAMETMGIKQDYTVASVDKLSEKVDGIDNRMDAVESKPAKRWEKVIDTVLAVIVTAVIAFMLGRFGF